MNVLNRSAITVLSLGLVVLSPGLVSAASAKVTVENMRGSLVNAWFSTTDGCIQTDTFVTANGSTDQLLPGRAQVPPVSPAPLQGSDQLGGGPVACAGVLAGLLGLGGPSGGEVQFPRAIRWTLSP